MKLILPYITHILPVANYAPAVWGYKTFKAPWVLQNRIQRFFLGVYQLAPLPATMTEMDWVDIV